MDIAIHVLDSLTKFEAMSVIMYYSYLHCDKQSTCGYCYVYRPLTNFKAMSVITYYLHLSFGKQQSTK